MRIGVLALQGAFAEHIKMLDRLGAESFEIRQLRDLETDLDGLIIPGGESTVIGRLMNEGGMTAPIAEKIRNGMPVFGTCAGLIMLAKNIANDDRCCNALGLMDITAVRNAYGRQLGSFSAEGEFSDCGKIPMVFIRAPYISEVGDARVLSVTDGKITAAREKNMLVTAFHPELTENTAVHEYFLKMCSEAKK